MCEIWAGECKIKGGMGKGYKGVHKTEFQFEGHG